jgi:hypothetical protein
MDINLSISAAPGIISDYLVAAIYEATAPATLVQSQGFAAPHTTPQNISFVNVNPVPHIVIIYQNNVNTPAGTIRHQFLYDPTFKNAVLRSDLVLTADSSAGFSSANLFYTDATLKGWSFDIERRGFGTMELGVDYSYDDTLGKWTLLATIDTPTPAIQPGEKFIIHFQPQITTVSGTSSGSSGPFSSSFDVIADVTLTAADMGKCGMISGTGDHLTITLPSLAAVPDNKPILFLSEGGGHINAAIKAAGTDTFKFMGATPSVVNMGKSEHLWVFKKNNKWNCYGEGNYKTVGEIIDQYSTDPAVILNTVFADGSILSRVTYARLWKYVLSLDASEVVNDTAWLNPALNNKGRYSTGDGSTTFRVPMLYTNGFLRAVDGVTRKAGSFEDYMFPDHKHAESIGTLPAGSTPDGHGPATQNQGRYAGSAVGQPDLTSSPKKADGTASTNIGSSNYPANSGIYKLIRS